MRLSSLATGQLVENDSTHGLFDIDDFLSDEPMRKRQGAMSRSHGPMRMGRRMEDIPDPHSEGPQVEPDEEGYGEGDGEDTVSQFGDMPDYGVNDAENAEEAGGDSVAVGPVGPEPEDELVGTNKLRRPGPLSWRGGTKMRQAERSWKANRLQQHL